MLASSLSCIVSGGGWTRRRAKLYVDVTHPPLTHDLLAEPGMVGVRIATDVSTLMAATDWRTVSRFLTQLLRSEDEVVDAVDRYLPDHAPFREVLDEAERIGWSSESVLGPARRRGNQVIVRRVTEPAGTRVLVSVTGADPASVPREASFVMRDMTWIDAIGAVRNVVWTSATTFELRPVVTAGTHWGPIVQCSLDDVLTITGVTRHGYRVEV